MTIKISKVSFRLTLFSLLLFAGSLAASAQRPFQGEWKWAIYATSRSELPPAYRSAPLREIPGAAVYLKLKQRGNRLSGEYSASRRYLAKLEEGDDIDTIVKGKTAEMELTSGFGGKVTVRLVIAGNRLHWKTIKAEGEHYFPDDVFLHRISRRARRGL
jgi:hypothetical protein